MLLETITCCLLFFYNTLTTLFETNLLDLRNRFATINLTLLSSNPLYIVEKHPFRTICLILFYKFTSYYRSVSV